MMNRNAKILFLIYVVSTTIDCHETIVGDTPKNRHARQCPTCPVDSPEILSSPWYGTPLIYEKIQPSPRYSRDTGEYEPRKKDSSNPATVASVEDKEDSTEIDIDRWREFLSEHILNPKVESGRKERRYAPNYYQNSDNYPKFVMTKSNEYVPQNGPIYMLRRVDKVKKEESTSTWRDNLNSYVDRLTTIFNNTRQFMSGNAENTIPRQLRSTLYEILVNVIHDNGPAIMYNYFRRTPSEGSGRNYEYSGSEGLLGQSSGIVRDMLGGGRSEPVQDMASSKSTNLLTNIKDRFFNNYCDNGASDRNDLRCLDEEIRRRCATKREANNAETEPLLLNYRTSDRSDVPKKYGFVNCYSDGDDSAMIYDSDESDEIERFGKSGEEVIRFVRSKDFDESEKSESSSNPKESETMTEARKSEKVEDLEALKNPKSFASFEDAEKPEELKESEQSGYLARFARSEGSEKLHDYDESDDSEGSTTNESYEIPDDSDDPKQFNDSEDFDDSEESVKPQRFARSKNDDSSQRFENSETSNVTEKSVNLERFQRSRGSIDFDDYEESIASEKTGTPEKCESSDESKNCETKESKNLERSARSEGSQKSHESVNSGRSSTHENCESSEDSENCNTKKLESFPRFRRSEVTANPRPQESDNSDKLGKYDKHMGTENYDEYDEFEIDELDELNFALLRFISALFDSVEKNIHERTQVDPVDVKDVEKPSSVVTERPH